MVDWFYARPPPPRLARLPHSARERVIVARLRPSSSRNRSPDPPSPAEEVRDSAVARATHQLTQAFERGDADGALACIRRCPEAVAAAFTDSEPRSTPLHELCRRPRVWPIGRARRLVHELFQAGCPVSQRDRDGNTPLHLAAEGGGGGLMDLLLDIDANPNALNTRRHAPVELAANAAAEGCYDSATGRTALARLMSLSGSTLHRTERRWSGLHGAVAIALRQGVAAATARRALVFLQALLEAGANPETTFDGSLESTALGQALQRGTDKTRGASKYLEPVVRTLLTAGCSFAQRRAVVLGWLGAQEERQLCNGGLWAPTPEQASGVTLVLQSEPALLAETDSFRVSVAQQLRHLGWESVVHAVTGAESLERCLPQQSARARPRF